MSGHVSCSHLKNIPLVSLMKTALGEEDADLAIVNARLVNVYSGEIIDSCSVGVKGEWIAWVGDIPKELNKISTRIIDAEGKTLIPGLIDGHTHLAWLTDPAELVKHALKGGTTTIVTETMETFPIQGSEGVLEFLASLKHQPIKIFATAPAMGSISQKTKGMSVDILKNLLKQDEIVGLGESYWQSVIQDPDIFLPMFSSTLGEGKVLEGHSAGASGKKLMAYAACGISSCHEPITAEQVIFRLRLGLYVMIREGSIRRDLEEISKIKDFPIDFRRLVLVTDGVTPADILNKGYMEYVVQKAIDCGFNPITAIQMATLNVAEHFSIDSFAGGIAPGKHADLLIIPDPKTITPECVISRGSVVAEKGKILVFPRKYRFSEKCFQSVNLPEPMKPSDFIVSASGAVSSARIRTIDVVTELVTHETVVDMPVINGEIRADIKKNIIKVAAIDRVHVPGNRFVGFVSGTGMVKGAFASSAAWDASDIILVGANDEDMALAVNRIREMQGGAVACNQGRILAELPLPVMGVMSQISIDEMASKIEEIQSAIAILGVKFSDPLLTIVTLTGAAIPYLRICSEGLVNLKTGKTTGLFV